MTDRPPSPDPAAGAGSRPAPSFDRAKFDRDLPLLGLLVESKMCGEVLTRLKGSVLTRPRLRHIVDRPPSRKLVLLSETVRTLSDLPPDQKSWVDSEILAGRVATEPHVTRLDWTHLSVTEILRSVLADVPELRSLLETNTPSSFESVGRVAHVNLPKAFRPYSKVVGEVLIAKNPRIKTVVNKVSKIENQFRTIEGEIIAGDGNLVTCVSESGCNFDLDFGRVYWNSRLGNEHQRLVTTFRRGDVLVDAFAGVGPFAVPAAKQVGCRVLANDLNPASYEYLVANARSNKVGALVECFNLDAREFVRRQLPGVLSQLAKRREEKGLTEKDGVARIVMNLPKDAVTFLDAIADSARDIGAASWGRGPVVHVYAFSISEDPLEDILSRARAAAGPGTEVALVTQGEIKGVPPMHDVRDVAPGKRMYCVSLRILPLASPPGPPPAKRACPE